MRASLPPVRVTVKLFGALREQAGSGEVSLDLPEGAPASAVVEALAGKLPALAALGPRVVVSVGQEVVRRDHPLAEGDEVALLPPVSGGAPRCSLSEAPLDAEEVARRVAGPDAGGLVTFVGTVRGQSRGHVIRRLEYEAYPGMAEREMEKIAEEAGRRWPGTRVAIAHRVGPLEVGEAAVVVAAAAPHRAEAFEACRFAIDTLKATVPIWKKEVAEDGAWWVDEHP